ncbi:unnamed protein product [Paramecium octaurelia]|uniref:Transmembrane protein n=1 Tax=Paramecium octaurelia TaxID=43137 RepID=A0A8S1RXP6_PAROT|nr:unnamed protein product [Paramecium octaurelia]
MKFLHYLDLFGISYEQPYLPNKKTYKSSFGGFFTIALYSLSLLYFVYKLHSWLSGNINPKSTQTYQVLNNVDLQLNYPLISISFDQNTQQLDPLNSNEMIIQTYLITQQNQSINIVNVEAQNNNKIVLDNFNFSLTNSQTSLYPTQTLIALQLCDKKTQANCASDEKIKQFLELSGISMKIDMNFLYFNAQTNQFERITKSLSYAIETDVTLLNVFQLQTQKNIINNGFLFDNMVETQVVNDVQIITQSVKQAYFKNYLNGLIAVYEFNLNQLTQIQSIQYTKISEILADVGSIISTLMMLKGLAIAMNTYLLEELLNQQIISCYYPQFKELSINRNLFGQIKSVQHFNSQIDLIEFNKFYTKAKQVALKKQTVINQIYEISRLQFLVQLSIDKNKISQSHKFGIPLHLDFNNRSNTIVPFDDSIQASDRDKIYGNEDFNILTLENI